MKDIGSVDDFQCFPHIVVRDQHTDAAIFQMSYQFADLANGDRVNPCKRFSNST